MRLGSRNRRPSSMTRPRFSEAMVDHSAPSPRYLSAIDHSESPGPTMQVAAACSGVVAVAAGGAVGAPPSVGADVAGAGAGGGAGVMAAGVEPAGAGAACGATGREVWTAPAIVPRVMVTGATTSTAAAMRAARRSESRAPAPATVSRRRTRAATEPSRGQQHLAHETQATMARRSKRPPAESTDAPSQCRGRGRPTNVTSTVGTATKTTSAATTPVTRSASLRRTVSPPPPGRPQPPGYCTVKVYETGAACGVGSETSTVHVPAGPPTVTETPLAPSRSV